MKKILSVAISSLLTVLIYTGCSKEQMAKFQQNEQEPEYNLLKLFDGFPALHSAVDSLDSQRLNDSLGDMLINGYETPQFLRDATGLIEAPFLVPMIGELHGILKLMMDPADYHYKDSGKADKGYYDDTDGSIDRLAQFYAALDQVVDNTELSGDILAMATQVVDYLVKTKTPAEIESDMGSMMKVRVYLDCMHSGTYVDLPVGSYPYTTLSSSPWNFTTSGGFLSASSIKVPIGVKVTLYESQTLGAGNTLELTSDDRCLTDNAQGASFWNDRVGSIKVEYDITKLAKLLGKVTMSCDYPIWVNSSNVPPANRDDILTGSYNTNTDLGNATKGLIMLLYGLNQVAANDVTARNIIDNIIQSDLPALLNASGGFDTIKTTIINLSDLFAPNEMGSNTYNTSSDYNNASNPYVNASLKETMRDILPNVAKLLIRDDDSSTNDDSVKIFDEGDPTKQRSPIEALAETFKHLKDIGIDYSQPGYAVESSLRRMVEYNAFSEQRSSSSCTYKVSLFDHLLYTIGMGYNFGYLTRVFSGVNASGEPYVNAPSGSNGNSYQHGIATGGTLTINDTMYPLTSSALNTVATLYILGINSGSVINVWSDTYTLVMGQRYQGNEGGPSGNHAGQGKYIWRSNNSIIPTGGGTSQTGDDAYEFYMGYDYPVQLLLGPSAVGDAGIPNGGRKAITPTSNATTATVQGGTEQVNDYRTYWPKAADGKGMLNTGAWMFNWISRACWDGAGPYYYADSSATQKTINGHTGYAYYKPNGEIYALVDKSGATWVYYYPATGNDAVDPDPGADGQRFNRYRYIYKSDYYAVQRGHEHGSTTLVCSTVSNSNGLAFAMPPMNQSGTSYAVGTTGTSKYDLQSKAQGTAAQQFWAYEKVQEWSNGDSDGLIANANDPSYPILGNNARECPSQEEAIFRNYQWLTLEKKFLFILPMCMFADWGASAVGSTVDAYLDSAAFVVIEANGLVGLANAKKNASGLGYWNILGSEGIGNDNVSCRNNPDYGNSYRPADSRIIPFVLPFSQPAINAGIYSASITNGTINASVVYGLLGSGHVLPDIIGNNIAPVQRLGFIDQTGYVASNFTADPASDSMWDKRNKVLPVFVALAGVMSDGTYYEAATSGYNYNYSASANHKYPLNDFFEGVMIPLSKPLFRYYTDSQAFGGSSSTGRWVPRMEDEDINNYADAAYDDRFSYFMPDIYSGARDPNYRPRSSLRTIMSVLADGNTADGLADGILPLLTNTQIVSRVLSLLQQFGNSAHDTRRPYIFKGMEQFVTAMKVQKSEVIGTAGRSSLNYDKYAWMFNTSMRNEDIDLEDLLGYEGPFRSDQTTQWNDFQKTYNMLASFMGGSRNITPNLVNVVNAILAQPLTENQVHGLLYTAGKLFARHDSSGWRYHGYDHGASDTYDQLVDILAYLPQVHDVMKTPGGTGEKYDRLLRNVDMLLKDNNSLVHFMLGSMTTPYPVRSVVEDLDRFLDWSIISDPNSPLWDDLVLMLDAMADMNDPRIDISVIIKNLGFQAN